MRCHVCSSLAHSKNIFHLKGLVSSDCQPANISCNIFYCDKCELVQKEIDAEWLNAADNIYQNYKIYHQAAGEEQKVRSLDGLKFESRSELIVHWLSNKLEAHQFGELLDVGCGNGAFLRVFNSKFGAWSLTGSEIGDKYKQDILNIDDNKFPSFYGINFIDVVRGKEKKL